MRRLGLTPETAVGTPFAFNGGGDTNEHGVLSDIMCNGTIVRDPHFGFLAEVDHNFYWRPILRPSTSEDLPGIHAVWRRSVEATHDFLTREHLGMISDIVRDIYLPSTTFTLAVDGNDQPIAFLGGDAGVIDALFVDPDWFGKGVGRVLLEEALKRAPVVRLDVNEANAQARGFYRRMGFEEIGRSEKDSAGMPYPLIHMERRG